jgi:hypothetical protein
MNVVTMVTLALASLVCLFWRLIPDLPETPSVPEQHFRALNREFHDARPETAPVSAEGRKRGSVRGRATIPVRDRQRFQSVG